MGEISNDFSMNPESENVNRCMQGDSFYMITSEGPEINCFASYANNKLQLASNSPQEDSNSPYKEYSNSNFDSFGTIKCSSLPIPEPSSEETKNLKSSLIKSIANSSKKDENDLIQLALIQNLDEKEDIKNTANYYLSHINQKHLKKLCIYEQDKEIFVALLIFLSKILNQEPFAFHEFLVKYNIKNPIKLTQMFKGIKRIVFPLFKDKLFSLLPAGRQPVIENIQFLLKKILSNKDFDADDEFDINLIVFCYFFDENIYTNLRNLKIIAKPSFELQKKINEIINTEDTVPFQKAGKYCAICYEPYIPICLDIPQIKEKFATFPKKLAINFTTSMISQISYLTARFYEAKLVDKICETCGINFIHKTFTGEICLDPSSGLILGVKAKDLYNAIFLVKIDEIGYLDPGSNAKCTKLRFNQKALKEVSQFY